MRTILRAHTHAKDRLTKKTREEIRIQKGKYRKGRDRAVVRDEEHDLGGGGWRVIQKIAEGKSDERKRRSSEGGLPPGQRKGERHCNYNWVGKLMEKKIAKGMKLGWGEKL